MTDAARSRDTVRVPATVRPPARAAADPADPSWIDDAYRTYGRYLWALLGRLGVPQSSIEDVVQEIFLTAHRRRHAFRGDAQVRTWLHGIAVFTGRRHRDKLRRRERLLPQLSAGDERSPPTPEDAAVQEQALRRLDAALGRLPDAQREVFVLMDIAELPAPEIAAVLRVPLNTVYSRARLARERLRRILVTSEGFDGAP